MSFNRDVLDETVVRVLLGVAGSFNRDNTHGWWLVSSLALQAIRSALLFRVSLLLHSMIVFCASAGQTKRGFVSHSAAHIGAYSFHEDHIPRNVFVSPSL